MKRRRIGQTLVALLLLANAPISTHALQQRANSDGDRDHSRISSLPADAVQAGGGAAARATLEASTGLGLGLGQRHHEQNTNNHNRNNKNNDYNDTKHGLDARALTTLAPASDGTHPPADSNNNNAHSDNKYGDALAVRAPPSASKKSATGGLYSPLPARSLQDWAVEDVILMATVDGTLYARDRKTGSHRWSLHVEQPMIETIYHKNPNQSRNDLGSDAGGLNNQDPTNSLYWIIEPTQDGSIYLFSPKNSLGMQRLELTVKQLVEELSPHASENPPVVYTGEKRSHLYTVDISTGNIRTMFSPGNSFVSEDNMCRPLGSLGSASESECGALGNVTLGRTEYIVAIQNRITGEQICTIKYFEWGPNNRDKDLLGQYTSSKDNSHVYSLHDGKILAVESIREDSKLADIPKQAKYTQQFTSPVVKVFDVARYIHAASLDAPLIILPQPNIDHATQRSSKTFLDAEKKVFVNRTAEGSWYALSENMFPLVTREARPAIVSQQEWLTSLPRKSPLESWQVEKALVGIHDLSLTPNSPPPLGVPLIEAPKSPRTIESSGDDEIKTLPGNAVPSKAPNSDLLRFCIMLVVIALTVAGFRVKNAPRSFTERTKAVEGKIESEPSKALPDIIVSPAVPGEPEVPRITEPESEATGPIEVIDTTSTAEITVLPSAEDFTETADSTSAPQDTTAVDSLDNKENIAPQAAEGGEKVVKSVVFTDDVEEAVLPEIKVGDGADISEDHLAKTGSEESSKEQASNADEEATPKPKKKSHRGKRGGKKEAERRKYQAAAAAEKQTADLAESLAEGTKQADQQVVIIKPDATNSPGSNGYSPESGLRGLVIRTDKVLGNGSGGTFVFEGEFEGRQVAVKRMLPQYFELASQEVALLEQNDDHPNVIRYFCRREDEHFLYIALELCQASLWDLFRDGRGEALCDPKYSALIAEVSKEPVGVLRQLAEGIKHLHGFRIVHRDIKPQNMLIAYPKKNSPASFPRFVISDFGLCKTLPDGASTLIGATISAGTAGWKAPELISQPRDVISNGSSAGGTGGKDEAMAAALGVKRAVDIFSLGCVFFYVLTGGLHPYDDDEGWMAIRERNIKENRSNLAAIDMHGQDTVDLVKWMLSPNPEDRPTASEVLAHPFFWTSRDRLEFLSLASDRFDMEPRDGTSEALSELELQAGDIIGLPPMPKVPAAGSGTLSNGPLWSHIHRRTPSNGSGTGNSNNAASATAAPAVVAPPPPPPPEPNFLNQLDKKFVDTLGKQRKYNGARLVDLLRALRNKHHHWDDMPDEVKQRVGEVPEGYLQYWETRFPGLLVGVWRVVRGLGMGEEKRFERWFGERGG